MEKQEYKQEEIKALSLNAYQAKALTTRLPTATPTYVLLNLSAEVGEVQGIIAKAIRDGIKNPDEFQNKLKKEFGDVLWQLAVACADNGFTLEEVGRCNLDKLSDRQVRNVLAGSGDNR